MNWLCELSKTDICKLHSDGLCLYLDLHLRLFGSIFSDIFPFCLVINNKKLLWEYIERKLIQWFIANLPLHIPSLSAFSRISNSWTTCEFNRSLPPGTSSNWRTRLSVLKFIQYTSTVDVERFLTVNVRELGSLSFLIRVQKTAGAPIKNMVNPTHNLVYILFILIVRKSGVPCSMSQLSAQLEN